MRFLQDNTGCFDNETYYKEETAFFCFFTLIIRFFNAYPYQKCQEERG